MRLLIALIILVFVAAGVVFGALNADIVGYDFGFASLGLPKGGALLGALVLGWLLGGLVAWLGLGPLRRGRRGRRADTGEPAERP